MDEQQKHEGVPTSSAPNTEAEPVLHHEVFSADRRAFEDRADAAFTFRTPELDETLAAVEYEIRFGKSAVLVVGEAGLGKTQFVRSMLPRLSATDHAAVLTWPASGKRDVIREACKVFGVSVSSSRDSERRRTSRLERHLARHRREDSRHVLFIDQAENLSTSNLTQVTALTELESKGVKLLTIILAGQPRLLTRLDAPEHARLKQRLFGERTLTPLTRAQTAAYIAHRLAKAGAADSALFDPDAIAWIHQHARGIPRLINHLCNRAMLAAYGADESRITLPTLLEMEEPGVTLERSMDAESLGLPGSGASFDVESAARRHEDDDTAAADRDEPFDGASNDDGACAEWPTGPDTGGGSWDHDAIPYASAVSLAERQDQSPLSDSMDSLFVRGEALLNRLERALARADRMASSSESTIVRHQAVEKHLEALTDRAERVIGGLKRVAPEAVRSLSAATKQVQAIDRASVGGARVEAKLVSVAKALGDKADEVQDRVAQLMEGLVSGQTVHARLSDATDKVAAATAECDTKVERLGTLVQDADVRVEQLARMLDGEVVKALRAKISDSTERATANAVALEQRIDACTDRADHAAAGLETRAEMARGTLEAAGEEFTQFESTCRSRILELCQSTIEDRRAAFDEALRDVTDTLGAKISEYAERATANADAMEQRIDACTERADRAAAGLETRAGVVRGTLAAAGEEFSRFESTCRDRILEICQSTIEDQRAAFQRALHEVADASKRQVDTACDRASEFVADTEVRVGKLRSVLTESITASERRIDGVTGKAAAIQTRSQELQCAVDGLAQRADETIERLTTATRAGETVVDHMNADRGRSEEVRRLLTAATAEVDKASERVRVIREQAAECQQIAARFAIENATGQELVARLERANSTATNAHAEIEATVHAARDRARRIDSHNAAATTTLKALASATIEGRSTLASLRSISESTKESLERAQAQVEALTAGEAERTASARRMGLLIQAAHGLDTSLRGTVKQAGEQLETLTTTAARARETHAAVSGLLDTGRDVIERAENMARRTEQNAIATTEKIDRLIEDLWSLTGKAESTAARVQADITRAETVVASLTDGVGPAEKARLDLAITVEQATAQTEKTRDDLSAAVEHATAHTRTLASSQQHASELIEEIGALTDTLEAARETQDGMRDLVDDARGLCAELAAAGSDAQRTCLTLRELHQSAGALTGAQTELNTQSGAILETLTARLDTARAFAESSESLLSGFIERAESVEEKLATFDAQANNIRKTFDTQTRHINKTFTAAADRSQRAVKEAHSQAERLTRVGEVVRKVSAGLAQTTREAQRRLSNLQAANEESAARLSALTSVSALTHRTTEAMQAWVNESIAPDPNDIGVAPDGTWERPAPAAGRRLRESNVVKRHEIGQRVGDGGLSQLACVDTGDDTTTGRRDRASPAGGPSVQRRLAGVTPKSAAHAAEIARLIDESRRSVAATRTPRA